MRLYRNGIRLVILFMVSNLLSGFVSAQEKAVVPLVRMQEIYEQVKTPYKYGIVLKGEDGRKVDCPGVFRFEDRWYMTYIVFDGKGYETWLAESGDLLEWKTLGKILSFRKDTWDANQAAGHIALQDTTWGGSYQLQPFDGKYWMAYVGGNLEGYETDPLAGQVKFTFWHMTFFAWFCNMAMHIGMSDLSVFRFARKSWYAIASGAGMYVGHFMAWLSASILYAYQLHLDPADTDVLPGPLAYRAAGLAGLLCVVIAGWTTANPTIYRAGLAFQAIVPKTSRFTMTLITGAIATAAGMFPAIAMKLLGFVALYGMLLMPMGAVVFVDYWLIRKFGLQSYYAEVSGKVFNWAAGLAWFLTLGACWYLVQYAGIEIFYVSLPGWFVAAILYIVISAIYQKKMRSGIVQ